MLGFFAYAMRKGGLKMPAIKEVVAMNDGDVLPLPGSPIIIGMPGHSPGSVAIHVPSVGAVFVGDELTTRNVLTAVEHWIIPGHGPAWSGGAAALIAAYRAAENPA